MRYGASYVIGDENPIAIYLNTFGTNKIDEKKLLKEIKEKFDLSVNSAKEVSSIYTREELFGK